MHLPKYSFGIGDRFGHQGKAQLNALIKAQQAGIEIAPVWNKSNREHSIIGTTPAEVRQEADKAVKASNWKKPYFVDADHIGLSNVDKFIPYCDFFTIDVADSIGKSASEDQIQLFVEQNKKFIGKFTIPNIPIAFTVTESDIEKIAYKFLRAVKDAGDIYRHIQQKRPADSFVVEVSMDESDTPQTPKELFFILSAMHLEQIPVQTLAPKFTGRFNKGVDYVGNVEIFEEEFNQDIAVIQFSVKQFNLPENLKLSVHSGSDKFSIYKPVCKALKRFDAGVHVKTAGTTWLEEIIGLAEAGGNGLEIAKEVYYQSLDHFEELCAPYATVIDICTDNLPPKDTVMKWDGTRFARALRHDQNCTDFNPDMRQLLHVGYKVAAKMGKAFIDSLEQNESVIAAHVTENLWQRHIKVLFGLS